MVAIARWRKSFCRSQMVSDGVLCFGVDGSKWFAQLIFSQRFLSISHRMLVLIQKWARNGWLFR